MDPAAGDGRALCGVRQALCAARPDTDAAAFLALRREDDAIVGTFNFSENGARRVSNTYLGYHAFAPHAGRVTRPKGWRWRSTPRSSVVLHRVEVNIQPTNARSLALAQRIGFTREGFSRRYVKIGGRWRDHVRFAMLAEDWRTLRRKHLGKRSRAP